MMSDLPPTFDENMTKRRNPIPNRMTLGIDEAGRGPAIGPMVMAAVAIDSKTAASLTRKGLRDSKAFGAGEDAHAIRCELAAEVRKRAVFVATVEIEHDEIDRRVCKGELNVLEREIASNLIEQALAQALACDKIIADGKRMFSALSLRYEQFISVDRAEEHHASVAAASVIAKVIRDDRFNKIRARYEPELGPITGGGYANAATRKWVRAYVEKYGRLPDEARQSWPYPFLEDLLGTVRPLTSQIQMFA
jgi:ribonuclease HII